MKKPQRTAHAQHILDGLMLVARAELNASQRAMIAAGFLDGPLTVKEQCEVVMAALKAAIR